MESHGNFHVGDVVLTLCMPLPVRVNMATISASVLQTLLVAPG